MEIEIWIEFSFWTLAGKSTTLNRIKMSSKKAKVDRSFIKTKIENVFHMDKGCNK